MMSTQPATVVSRAPTATGLEHGCLYTKCGKKEVDKWIYQKSLGVPSQQRGVIPAATITIQTHRDKLTSS